MPDWVILAIIYEKVADKNVNSLKEMRSHAAMQLPDAHRKIRGGAQAKTHDRSRSSGYGAQRGLRVLGLAKSLGPTETPNDAVPAEHRNQQRSRDI